MSLSASAPSDSKRRDFAFLALASLGVVYGDIGTSPLYALRECFNGPHSLPATESAILGVLSLVFWSLTITVSCKYLLYVLRADNRGEGGILALMVLALSRLPAGSRKAKAMTLLGLCGASLLYGESAITPAISVLSAVEGLEVAVPGLGHLEVPLTLAVLAVLFMLQRQGSGGLGSVFGPVTLLWFITIGTAGLAQIIESPSVLWAVNPIHAVRLVTQSGAAGFLVMGAVVLVITGAEALYADMGHFGRGPIRITWFAIVKPALLLNYFGQGALLLSKPQAAANPFYLIIPEWGRLPMVVLATTATVIASQALISGIFSLTRQASMLGYWPRISIRHTSASRIGQIYVPFANWALFLATCALVVGFGSSSELAGAYGIAVTGTMLITSTLAASVARNRWGWRVVVVAGITLGIIVPEAAYFSATTVKIMQGGWVPALLAVGLLVAMTTWKEGRRLVGRRFKEQAITLDEFFDLMRVERPARVPGAAVFMSTMEEGLPPALMRNFEHNRVVHELNVLLTVKTVEVPRVNDSERLQVSALKEGFVRVEGRYGFMEEPNVPELLERANIEGFDLAFASYFFGREILLADNNIGMHRWRKRMFAFLAHNSLRATTFFRIPPDQVVELGAQVEL